MSLIQATVGTRQIGRKRAILTVVAAAFLANALYVPADPARLVGSRRRRSGCRSLQPAFPPRPLHRGTRGRRIALFIPMSRYRKRLPVEARAVTSIAAVSVAKPCTPKSRGPRAA